MSATRLIVPLSTAQVRSGIAIYDYVPWFKVVDGVLADLRTDKPGFDDRSTLLKILAINTLYAAGVQDVHRATDHVVGVMSRPVTNDDVQLVEGLAKIPKKSGDSGYCPVFASKFAHFFIRDSVPIFDSFAKVRVSHHLGLRWGGETPISYSVFFEKIGELRTLTGISESARNLDKHLWVASEYAAFKAGSRKLNIDLVSVFEERPVSLTVHLDALLDEATEGA